MIRFFLPIFLGLSLTTFAQRNAPPIPDFTAGDKLDRNAPHDWNLGPTGARGWVYAHRGESTASRQILITDVAGDSPASGVLEKDDVILGLDGQNFDSDARIAFAKKITEAEAGDGKIKVIRWRAGKTEPAEIQIAVLGKYSPTAPYDCDKSKRIFENGCESIARNIRKPDGKRRHPIVRALNAMSLLASGEEKYLPLVKQEIEWAKTWEISEGDLHCWPAGWVNLFLAEYLLKTGDKSVLPAMKKLSYEIANGQSNVGTWGHRFAYEHNGILRGYGAMNQVGLSLTASLIIAREAGIDDPEVDDAIAKSRTFLEFYAGRGAIPYGDHHPWLQMHDDNGKASAAAVMFDFLGEKEPTEFFSKMGTASYGIERETGHTGNFFNMLWALPGVSRSGPEATGAWVRESAWLLDLARTHDGGFDFLGKPAATGGEHSYRNWDCAGVYLLGYSLGRKETRFTGKKESVAESLSRAEVEEIIETGRGWMPATKAESYDQRSVDELLENLASWSPVVRERAAIALAKKDDPKIVPALLEMAASPDKDTIFGACAGFEQLKGKGAEGVGAMQKLLAHDDFWVKAQAAEALAGIGEPARVAVPDLLKLVAAPPDPADKRDYLQRYLAFALFNQRGGLLGRSIENVDRDLLREAAVAVLKNEDGRARGALSSVYSQLSADEIKPLLPAILDAVENQSPSGVMFSDGIRLAGLNVLADHRIAEGVPLCVDLIELDRWGSERRLTGCLNALKKYGAEAKSELPKIRAFAKEMYEHEKFDISKPESRRHNEKMAKHYETLLEIIEDIKSA
ncbi:MAG: acetylesterase [Verrucomicrobiales bacterium]|nr:acetylesterase [Verrucomicrobiales bacterium]